MPSSLRPEGRHRASRPPLRFASPAQPLRAPGKPRSLQLACTGKPQKTFRHPIPSRHREATHPADPCHVAACHAAAHPSCRVGACRWAACRAGPACSGRSRGLNARVGWMRQGQHQPWLSRTDALPQRQQPHAAGRTVPVRAALFASPPPKTNHPSSLKQSSSPVARRRHAGRPHAVAWPHARRWAGEAGAHAKWRHACAGRGGAGEGDDV